MVRRRRRGTKDIGRRAVDLIWQGERLAASLAAMSTYADFKPLTFHDAARRFTDGNDDPRAYLERTFEEVGGYDQLVVLKDIRFVSFCEHHMLPVIGKAHVGYLPNGRVVGISKLARVVNGFARRLQIQEKLTAEIAEAIQEVLNPHGVGVVIRAEHSCMTLRGVNTPGSSLSSSRLLGVIRDDPRSRDEFLRTAQQG